MQTTECPLTEAELNQFRRDGFVVARGLLSTGEALAIRDAFMDQAKHGPVAGLSEIKAADGEQPLYTPSDPLAFYPRMMMPHQHPTREVGKIAMKYLTDARIEAVLRELYGQPAYGLQTMFYFKPPGARGQDFHQDNFYLRIKPGNCMAAWIALDDCDAENGGMMCVPDTQDYAIQCPEESDTTQSFTNHLVRIPNGKTAVLPTMKPGDVLFFNGSTIHGSGPNRSENRFRRSLICHYAPADTLEMSHWYEAYDFSGQKLSHIAINQDGGPCGQAVTAPH
ncbi:MAG: phytanoyl-CoA dioxygenase family protein [Tepidisphaeraceae bacterium]